MFLHVTMHCLQRQESYQCLKQINDIKIVILYYILNLIFWPIQKFGVSKIFFFYVLSLLYLPHSFDEKYNKTVI